MEAAETKARYSSETFADYFQDGAMVVGALEGLEASLVLSVRPRTTRRDGSRHLRDGARACATT